VLHRRGGFCSGFPPRPPPWRPRALAGPGAPQGRPARGAWGLERREGMHDNWDVFLVSGERVGRHVQHGPRHRSAPRRRTCSSLEYLLAVLTRDIVPALHSSWLPPPPAAADAVSSSFSSSSSSVSSRLSLAFVRTPLAPAASAQTARWLQERCSHGSFRAWASPLPSRQVRQGKGGRRRRGNPKVVGFCGDWCRVYIYIIYKCMHYVFRGNVCTIYSEVMYALNIPRSCLHCTIYSKVMYARYIPKSSEYMVQT